MTTSASALPIRRIVFGVRYEPQWKVGDKLGEVIDLVLRRSGGVFGAERFPLSDSGSDRHRLWNPETRDEMVITVTDAVLNVGIRGPEYLNAVVEEAGSYERHVLDHLRDVCRVGKVVRYGLLAEFEECGAELEETPGTRYLSKDFARVRDFAMRFSYRLPTPQGHFRKGVNDFRNAIYTVMQDGDEKVRISLDYQEYFDPFLDSQEWKSGSYVTFVDAAVDFHTSQFAGWVGKIRRKPQAA